MLQNRTLTELFHILVLVFWSASCHFPFFCISQNYPQRKKGVYLYFSLLLLFFLRHNDAFIVCTASPQSSSSTHRLDGRKKYMWRRRIGMSCGSVVYVVRMYSTRGCFTWNSWTAVPKKVASSTGDCYWSV